MIRDYPRSTVVQVEEIKCLLSGGCTVFLQLDSRLHYNRAIIVNMTNHFMSHTGFIQNLKRLISKEENQYLIRMSHDDYQALNTAGVIDTQYVKLI